MIAHELKNPLMSIKGLAATGTRLYESMTDEERKDFFRLIDSESTRLKLVLDELSTALRIDAGALVYDIRPEPLGPVVEETVWRFPAGDHPVQVETEPNISVAIDRGRFEEVLTNVLDNAAKFSAPDSPIRVRAFRNGDAASVEVVDTGAGIPPEQREAIGKMSPLGRIAEVDDMVGWVLFLAAPESSYINGHILTVDGGWTAGYTREF